MAKSLQDSDEIVVVPMAVVHLCVPMAVRLCVPRSWHMLDALYVLDK